MKKKIRAFIALELSSEAADEVARVTDVLKDAHADVKWSRPGAVHLTLKFLGSISKEKVRSLEARLKEISPRTPQLDITLDDVGAFPGWDRPRVVWIGVADPDGRVKDLAGRVDEAMAGEGFEKEKRVFMPHLTIGRVKTSKNREKLKDVAGSVSVKPISSHITKMVFFKSELTTTGAVHEPLAVLDLAGK